MKSKALSPPKTGRKLILTELSLFTTQDISCLCNMTACEYDKSISLCLYSCLLKCFDPTEAGCFGIRQPNSFLTSALGADISVFTGLRANLCIFS